MTTTATLPRCPFKACPVRYRSGPDRLCRDHAGPDIGTVASRMAELMDAPGERDGDGKEMATQSHGHQ